MALNEEYITETAHNQAMQIKAHLESGKTITPIEALNLYGCFRLGARIWDLRHEYNMNIVTTRNNVGKGKKKVAEYKLVTV